MIFLLLVHKEEETVVGSFSEPKLIVLTQLVFVLSTPLRYRFTIQLEDSHYIVITSQSNRIFFCKGLETFLSC